MTAEMRQVLERVNKVHAGMAQKDIDEAVQALHREIARHDPKVLVPLAIHQLMRLVPRDTQTRVLLRQALAKGWLEAHATRASLVQAGDTPGPHIRALLKALDDKDPRVRIRAVKALGDTGAAGAEALPKLRKIVAKARADPADYDRAYTPRNPMPELVVAHHAILRIEAALRDRKPARR